MFNTSEQKKIEYWTYFVKKFRPHPFGFTQVRLKKVRTYLWNDDDFWDDVIWRHHGQDRSPEQMKDGNEQTYLHCMGNMAGMIRQTMQELKILKD